MYIEVACGKSEIKQSIKGGAATWLRWKLKCAEEFLLKLSRLGERTDEIIPKAAGSRRRSGTFKSEVQPSVSYRERH